jgi:hypothetical protein
MKESAPVEIARLEAQATKGERAALAAVDARLVAP